MRRLKQILKIQPGEGRMVALVTGIMLSASAGAAIGTPGIEALFFARFGVQFLPYLYIALGLVTFITSLLITALLGRLPRRRLYLYLPAALALALIAGRILVALDLRWFYPALWLGMNLMWALQALLLWGLAGMVCDTRQAKRLFPLFGAGGILGISLGGFVTRPLVLVVGAENLLLVWAALLIVALALVRELWRAVGETGESIRRWPAPLFDEFRKGFRSVRSSAFLGWISLAAVLFSVLFFAVAFPFSKAVAAQFPDEDAIAGFLGVFQGLTTASALLLSLFLANRIYARFGFMSAILCFALIYLAGFGLLAAYATFAALALFRLIQMAWLQGVAITAYQAALNVVPGQRREETRAFIDGVPGQAGVVLVGLTLVASERSLQPHHMYWIGLGAAAAVSLILWQARRAYGIALAQALREGQPQIFFSEEEPFGGFQLDATAVATAVAGLSDPDAGIRRVSVEILGNLAVLEAVDALVAALDDPEPEVRSAALRAIGSAGAADALLEVAACLRDPVPAVRLRAVEALGRLARFPRGLLAHLGPVLDDPEPAVCARAAAFILRHRPERKAKEALIAMATNPDNAPRMEAYRAIAEWGNAALIDQVLGGLHDPVPAVRCTAAEALPSLDPHRAVEALARALGDEDPAVREAVGRALGRIGRPALDRTVEALSDPSREQGALIALSYLPAQSRSDALRTYARRKIDRALYYHGLWLVVDAQVEAFDGDGRGELLSASLKHKALRQGVNALEGLGLTGDRGAITLAVQNLKDRDPNQRANALEILETISEARMVRPLLALWDPASGEPGAPDGWLVRLLQDQDPWLRACAVLVAGRSADPAIPPMLEELSRSDPDALVCEAAGCLLKGRGGMETLQTLSLMERILFLRRVPLFAEFSPADLKHVAAIAQERFYPDGEIISRQGEPGDEMYIIVAGEVKVEARADGGTSLEVARRGPGEYVGEMAIIDHEPRMATLIAGGEVRTLCLGQKQFQSILRERPEAGLAVMRVLCTRLREIQVVEH